MKLQALLPLTVSPRSVLRWLVVGAVVGMLCNLSFLYAYNQAYQALWYLGVDGVRHLKVDAVMPPFVSLLGISLYGCIAATLSMIPTVWLFWYSHNLESKSIYTMRRLSDPWELPRRCFTVPALAASCYLILTAALLLLDLAIYWTCTPAVLLPTSLWDVF